MFKANDNMRPGPTPERVLAICRLVSQGKYTSTDLFVLSELNKDTKADDEAIRRSIEAAEEIKIIHKNKNGKFDLLVEKNVLESAESFRKCIVTPIFSDKNSTFFKLTEWFIASSSLVAGINNFDDLHVVAARNGVETVSENDVLGWRFWMRFLGHAYQYNKTLIPNMKIRIQDALINIEPGTKMSSVQFVQWIKSNIPEASEACSNATLPVAVSNGLRVLHSEGIIELISTRDAIRTSLAPLRGVELNDFSDIIIKGGRLSEVD